MVQNSRSLGLLLGLVAVVMFGGSLPATRIAVAYLDPWFVTAARAAIAGILALGTLAISRPPYPRQYTMRLGLISLCLVIGFPALLAIASVTVPATHASVILGLLPLATTVAAVPLAGERPSLVFWILSLIGAGLVAAFALRDGNVAVVTGDIFLALAVTLTGVGYTLSGVMSRTMAGWQVIAWALLMALPLAIIVTIALWPANAASVPIGAWIGLIYVGAISQFIGYAFWNVALAVGGVARVGQLQLVQPFVSMGLAALFLGEAVDGEMIGFALAVVIVVALGRRAAVRTTASSP
ncbi:MAG TPA: DMT family transporter [Bauldia sp.]|nr:DMT family transporter [Bauldia sp.]